MFFRRPSQLALQASLWLAAQPESTVAPVREIAGALGVPAPYLSKVLNTLTRFGLLHSVRGPGGGVALSRSPREIHLWDVVVAMEPAGALEGCFLGLGQCNDSSRCPLHETWGPIRASLLAMLQTRSLAELAERIDGHGQATARMAPGKKESC